MNRDYGTFEPNLESWLELGSAAEQPDIVLDRVLARLDTTRQRPRSWLAWRPNALDLRVALIIGGLALVVVALPSLSRFNVGSADATPSATPRQSPYPSQANPQLVPFSIFLTPGERYASSFDPPGVTFAVPAPGWIGDQGVRVFKGDLDTDPPTLAIFYYGPEVAPANLYADPCARRVMNPPPGRSAGEMAAAMAAISSLRVLEAPTRTTVGGRPAWTIMFRVREDTACEVDSLAPDGIASDAGWSGDDGPWLMWFVDREGDVSMFIGTVSNGTSESVIREMRAIVASIEFE